MPSFIVLECAFQNRQKLSLAVHCCCVTSFKYCEIVNDVIFRVRTDPGKVWKVLEFNVEIFKALKTLENDHRYGKVWKNP